MSPAVATRGLTKRYGAVRAVVDLDLRVEKGEILAFLGPNGAGKSTTIRMLLALQRPTSGSARLLGLDSHADRVEIHRRTGYLPGDLELYRRMTGRRLVEWFLRARGATDHTYAEQLADRFHVVMDRPVKELSKGNRQKIGIVLAFMTRPELLVLDEPSVGLDPLMQNEFETLVRETAAEGRTVFLSSHELDEVQRVADRVAIIREGRLVLTDTVEGLRRSMPRRLEVYFRRPVDRALFDGLAGVCVEKADDGRAMERGDGGEPPADGVAGPDGTRLMVELTGDIAPLLRVIAANDPVDLVSRHADLEELFLDLYRGSEEEAGHAC